MLYQNATQLSYLERVWIKVWTHVLILVDHRAKLMVAGREEVDSNVSSHRYPTQLTRVKQRQSRDRQHLLERRINS